MSKLYIMILVSMILLGGLLLVSSGETREAPSAKIVAFSKQFIPVSNDIDLVREERLYQKYKASFDSLQETLRRNGQQGAQKMTLVFSNIEDPIPVNQDQRTLLDRPESYLILVDKNRVRVMAREDQGLLNGLSTLEALLYQYKGKLPQGLVVDYPDIVKRVLHLSLWPCTIQDFKECIRLARFGHYNGLILLNSYGVNLKSLQHLNMGQAKWSRAEFQEMVSFVKENGLEIIPELKLLSWQKMFLKDNRPEYLYNKDTYDPRVKELYDTIVFPAIDELLLLTGATKLHIGHDEVAGWSEYHFRKDILRNGEHQIPPELFLQDVLILYEYLKKKKIETWMWGDMLVSKEEFPAMKESGASLNGYNGYATLRPKIPEDIVICDWHYRGGQIAFPTAMAFAENGHQVLGATWKFQGTTKNFSKYIAQIPKNGAGMIATTWYGLSGKEKEEVQNIIKFSGETFWNAKQ